MPHDELPDTRPYLCIPYWTTPIMSGGSWDRGLERPLPSAVVSYACESIHASPYTPGQPLDVTVDVRNSGGGNSAAIATVVVYWAVPTVGFAKPNFFGATAVDVPPNRNSPDMATTKTLTGVIPASAPDHICLLACVSHAQDRAGTTCDPVSDRHWAQRNLLAVAAGPGAPVLIPIMVANPIDAAMALELHVGPVDARRGQRVAQETQTEFSDQRARVRLLDEQGGPVSDEGVRIQAAMDLGPLAERSYQLLIELDADLGQGRSTAVEAELLTNDDERRVVGSLGVALLPPGGD
jgi:hypothetical protein